MELAFWDSVKGSSSPSELQAYLTQFPDGTFAPLARARIAMVTAPPPPAPAVARAAPAPAVPATAPPPAVAAPPQQMAALPPASAPVTESSFDGTYTAQVRSGRGNSTAVLTIKDLRVTGRISEFLGLIGNGRCSIVGRLEVDGVIRDMNLDCVFGSAAAHAGRFIGRFAPDPATGKIVGQTRQEAPGTDRHGHSNTWTQGPPSSVAGAEPAPQQMAALPPATGPLPAAAFDGTYASQVRLSNVAEETAVITIKDLRISGRIGSECAFGGQLESSGEIREFHANCTGTGRASGTVRYVGRFAPDPANGQIVGKTVMQSPGMSFHGISNTWVRR